MNISKEERFIIASKIKVFSTSIYDFLENVSRKDYFYKDKFNYLNYDLLYNIYLLNSISNNNIEIVAKIKTNLSLIDYMLECLFYKHYLTEKQLNKYLGLLIDINKMVNVWIKNRGDIHA